MPYIDTKTSAKITNEQKERLIKEFGAAIELIPGKSEEWLMVNVAGDQTMAFRGDFTSPCVMVEIAIFGKASSAAYDALTECVCGLVQRILGVAGDRTYVKYTEISHWGYNGFNF